MCLSPQRVWGWALCLAAAAGLCEVGGGAASQKGRPLFGGMKHLGLLYSAGGKEASGLGDQLDWVMSGQMWLCVRNQFSRKGRGLSFQSRRLSGQ